MSDPSGATPTVYAPRACSRCSTHKKKCDRLLPSCTACTLASVPCEAPIKSTDRKLLREITKLRDENVELRNQIARLQTGLSPQNGTLEIEDYSRFSPGAPLPSTSPPNLMPVFPLPVFAIDNHPAFAWRPRPQALPGFILTSFGLQDDAFIDQSNNPDPDDLPLSNPSNPLVSHGMSTSSIFNALPSMKEAHGIIQSLLESAKHGPSNLDKIIQKSQLEEDCRLVYGPGGLTAPEYGNSRFRCFITVYLAMCMAAAVNGEDPRADPQAMACRAIGMKELALVTSREDLCCVEALTLLCELAIHEPNGSNLWQLVGLTGRTAIAINLHRRDDVYLPTVYPSWPAVDDEAAVVSMRNQRRKDLFWAFYSIDRLTTFILNRPGSIKDEDIDVELPPLTMWPEGKYATASSEALWVHHLYSRRLYGQIYASLYAVSKLRERDTATKPEEVVAGYVQQVQQWYMCSRFNATVVPFSDDSVKRHLLDDLQYHLLMMALHQPSPLIPTVSSTYIAALKRSASLAVNLFHHSASRKQLNVHWINLHHCFTTCAVLIYCFRQFESRPDLMPVPQEEITLMLARCRQTLPLFCGTGASLVRRYEVMLSKIITAFEMQQQQATASTEQVMSPAPARADSTGVQSRTDSGQGPAFDINMMFNGLLPEGDALNLTTSPTFAEYGMSTELANFMLPESMWEDKTGYGLDSRNMEMYSPPMETEEDIEGP